MPLKTQITVACNSALGVAAIAGIIQACFDNNPGLFFAWTFALAFNIFQVLNSIYNNN